MDCLHILEWRRIVFKILQGKPGERKTSLLKFSLFIREYQMQPVNWYLKCGKSCVPIPGHLNPVCVSNICYLGSNHYYRLIIQMVVSHKLLPRLCMYICLTKISDKHMGFMSHPLKKKKKVKFNTWVYYSPASLKLHKCHPLFFSLE